MSSPSDWEAESGPHPRAEDFTFDLDRALSSVVALRSSVPGDAFTAGTLGTERIGSGTLIRDDGLVLTIGYLVTEAESIWLSTSHGKAVPGHVLGYDQETGFGLVQALGRLDLPTLPLGNSSRVRASQRVVVAAAGGRQHAIVAEVAARQEFAGYWEYVLDDAIITAPAHPQWNGTAVIDEDGALVAVGSLHLQQGLDKNDTQHLNMNVPVDLLKPILDDVAIIGRRPGPARPWLGLYAAEIEDKVVIAGLASGGPARQGGVRTGDVVISVGSDRVGDLAGFFRSIWNQGEAGVEIPLLVQRNERNLQLRIRSSDRARFLKSPPIH